MGNAARRDAPPPEAAAPRAHKRGADVTPGGVAQCPARPCAEHQVRGGPPLRRRPPQAEGHPHAGAPPRVRGLSRAPDWLAALPQPNSGGGRWGGAAPGRPTCSPVVGGGGCEGRWRRSWRCWRGRWACGTGPSTARRGSGRWREPAGVPAPRAARPPPPLASCPAGAGPRCRPPAVPPLPALSRGWRLGTGSARLQRPACSRRGCVRAGVVKSWADGQLLALEMQLRQRAAAVS